MHPWFRCRDSLVPRRDTRFPLFCFRVTDCSRTLRTRRPQCQRMVSASCAVVPDAHFSPSLASPAVRAILSCFLEATSRSAAAKAAPLETRKRQAATLFPLLPPTPVASSSDPSPSCPLLSCPSLTCDRLSLISTSTRRCGSQEEARREAWAPAAAWEPVAPAPTWRTWTWASCTRTQAAMLLRGRSCTATQTMLQGTFGECETIDPCLSKREKKGRTGDEWQAGRQEGSARVACLAGCSCC